MSIQDLGNLNEDELVRFGFMFMSPFRIFETLYFQFQRGTVDATLWDAEKRSMQFFLNQPGSLAWWRANPLSFTPEFRNFIESEVLSLQGGT